MTHPSIVAVRLSTYIRFGVLEDDEGQGEVSLGLADQIFSEQRLCSTLLLPLTPMQEWHHPLEDIFHVTLRAGLLKEKKIHLREGLYLAIPKHASVLKSGTFGQCGCN